MSTTDERELDPVKEMTRVAQTFLDLASWSFKTSYSSSKLGILIYDSEWCRISLVWGGWDPLGGNTIHIRYGRLHAPNEKVTMLWNGEECRCWHDFSQVLHFLDGLSPTEAAQRNYSHPITDPFYQEEFRQKYSRRQPEWLAQMHATIWSHYGKEFFGLFDLRQPELWEKYSHFLKQLYDIKGRSRAIRPPPDKVC